MLSMGFRIGDIVRRKDGDGRPHRIVDVKVHGPLNRNEHTFFEFIFEDGGAEVFPESLELYKGDYKERKE